MTKRAGQLTKSRRRNRDKAESAGSKLGKIRSWQWIPIVAAVCAILGFFLNCLIQPTFFLREKEDTINENLVMSAKDLPPVNLVYIVTNKGQLQSEYAPSPSYTLYTERKIVFFNPIICAPRRTYHPPHKGSQLVAAIPSPYLGCRKMNDASVTVWPTARHSSVETSSIELLWELSYCSADGVTFSSQIHNDALRVYVSNPNNYRVRYLALVKLQPLRTNSVYTTTIEHSAPTGISPSESLPKISSVPKSLEIRSVRDIGSTFEVNLPVVIEMDQYRQATFDVQIYEQPPTISLVLQPSAPAAAATPSWVWTIIAIGAALIIVTLIIILTLR